MTKLKKDTMYENFTVQKGNTKKTMCVTYLHCGFGRFGNKCHIYIAINFEAVFFSGEQHRSPGTGPWLRRWSYGASNQNREKASAHSNLWKKIVSLMQAFCQRPSSRLPVNALKRVSDRIPVHSIRGFYWAVAANSLCWNTKQGPFCTFSLQNTFNRTFNTGEPIWFTWPPGR